MTEATDKLLQLAAQYREEARTDLATAMIVGTAGGALGTLGAESIIDGRLVRGAIIGVIAIAGAFTGNTKARSALIKSEAAGLNEETARITQQAQELRQQTQEITQQAQELDTRVTALEPPVTPRRPHLHSVE